MTYDVVVVGGGPAGLSGAVALGRALRSVLVIDAGTPRNAPADGIHNYLTSRRRPGQKPVPRSRRRPDQKPVPRSRRRAGQKPVRNSR